MVLLSLLSMSEDATLQNLRTKATLRRRGSSLSHALTVIEMNQWSASTDLRKYINQLFWCSLLQIWHTATWPLLPHLVIRASAANHDFPRSVVVYPVEYRHRHLLDPTSKQCSNTLTRDYWMNRKIHKPNLAREIRIPTNLENPKLGTLKNKRAKS